MDRCRRSFGVARHAQHRTVETRRHPREPPAHMRAMTPFLDSPRTLSTLATSALLGERLTVATTGNPFSPSARLTLSSSRQ
jgi:hypothetical protein